MLGRHHERIAGADLLALAPLGPPSHLLEATAAAKRGVTDAWVASRARLAADTVQSRTTRCTLPDNGDDILHDAALLEAAEKIRCVVRTLSGSVADVVNRMVMVSAPCALVDRVPNGLSPLQGTRILIVETLVRERSGSIIRACDAFRALQATGIVNDATHRNNLLTLPTEIQRWDLGALGTLCCKACFRRACSVTGTR